MTPSSFSPDELRAAADVHGELGPDYRDAVLESFLDKVGRDIDARVDARLHGQRYPMQPGQMQAAEPPAARKSPRDKSLALAIVSIALGIPLTAIAVGNSDGSGVGIWALLVVWASIAVINVAYTRRKD
ncbi:MAG: hypothetical protein ACRDNZ_03675 [Streptosporangiaceae bacterium]